jgi:hypothetical protein
MSIPFSYAVVDDEGEVIRKHRWSVKEAKWFTENNPNVKVIRLEKVKQVKEEGFNYDEFTKLYGKPIY